MLLLLLLLLLVLGRTAVVSGWRLEEQAYFNNK
jgi:hypothetical protein